MFSMLQQNKIFTICIMNIVVLIVCVILSILLLKTHLIKQDIDIINVK